MASITRHLTLRSGYRYRARVRIKGHSLSKTFTRKWDAIDWAMYVEIQLQGYFYPPGR